MLNPINAVKAQDTLSAKYQFASTKQILDTFFQRGFTVSGTSIAKVRKSSKDGFQTHVVRLTHPDLSYSMRRIEILVKNDHSGAAALELSLGIYEFVCANGLVIGNDFYTQRIKHVGRDFFVRLNKTIDTILQGVDRVHETIIAMQSVQLTELQRYDFISRALALRLPVDAQVMFNDYMAALKNERPEQSDASLWSVMNTVQERVLNGGVKYYRTIVQPDGSKVTRSNTLRRVSGIDSNLKFNKAIWNMAESVLNVSKAA